MKLYEINQQIEELIDFETGEIADVEKLEQLQLDRKDKVDNTIKFIKNQMASIETIKNEIESLSNKKKVLENAVKNLREYLQRELKGEKFKSALFSVSYRTIQSLEVDEKQLPKKYWVVVKKPDKLLIKNQFKTGKKVKGCQMIEKVSMIIK